MLNLNIQELYTKMIELELTIELEKDRVNKTYGALRIPFMGGLFIFIIIGESGIFSQMVANILFIVLCFVFIGLLSYLFYLIYQLFCQYAHIRQLKREKAQLQAEIEAAGSPAARQWVNQGDLQDVHCNGEDKP